MTISPPAKVKNDPVQDFTVLASGFDTLNLAIDLSWGPLPAFFLYLEGLKAKAKECGGEQRGVIRGVDGEVEWNFTIPSYGAKGYEWILNGRGFTFKIGSWLERKSMPNVLVEIRSETLWHLGAKNAVDIVLDLLMAQGAKNIEVKPSRADLCVDIVVPTPLWDEVLLKSRVTRAKAASAYWSGRTLTGIGVGKGKLTARIYDKPLEIRQKSKKFWMYDIWGIKEVPKGKVILRVEFQLRRECLVELGLKSIPELFSHYKNAWKYCAEKWLKFQTNTDKHHTQRKTFPWWEIVQKGFRGAQGAEPLVRCKSISQEKERIQSQLFSSWASLLALENIESGNSLEFSTAFADSVVELLKRKKQLEKSGKDFQEIVSKKAAKNAGLLKKQSEAYALRQKQGFPTGI